MQERIYTINLKYPTLKYARWKNSQKSSRVVREFLKKHMKTEQVKIGRSISEKIWKRGDQKPPSKIKIKAIKTDDGTVKAELFGVVIPEEIIEETKKPKEKKEDKKESKEKQLETKEKSANK